MTVFVPGAKNSVHCAVIYVQKERKLLQVKRLDLDAAKTRLKKARMADARAAVSIHAHTHRSSSVQHCHCSGMFMVFLMLINEQPW